MSVIVCYGDSNTHGTRPMSQTGVSVRHAPGDRWPNVMAAGLGAGHQVISEGLPGRTTVHNDHVEGGARNGIAVLPAILHSHKPIDLLILMLGTNDLKNRFSVTAYEIGRSIERMVLAARAEAVVADILIVCPTPVRETGCLADVFAGAETRQVGTNGFMQAAAERLGCSFVDAGEHARVSDRDGVHWEADQHHRFGQAMANIIKALL